LISQVFDEIDEILIPDSTIHDTKIFMTPTDMTPTEQGVRPSAYTGGKYPKDQLKY